MKVVHLTYHKYALINAPKIHTDLLWDLSILFIVLGVLYFAFVFIFRNKLSAKSSKIAQRKRELTPMISTFLFLEEDASKDEKSDYIHLKIEIRELLKIKFNRELLTEILLDLQRDLSGDARKRLFNLYTDLGLHLDAFKKLKSWRWEVVSKGILQLTHMQVTEAHGFIKKFINHRRSVIRKQAQIATVSLKNEGISYFLDTNKHSISEWQQLKLLDVIRNLEDFDAPRFKAWLTAKNKDTVLFSLRLIKYYKQNDASSAIIQLVKHRNNQIKTEAIHCIREFCFFEALDTLKSVFRKCNADIKILILDTIASLGKEEDIAFLEDVEKRETNFNVKSKALSAINTIVPDSVLPKEGINEIPSEELWKDSDAASAGEQLPIVSENIHNTENQTEIMNNQNLWDAALHPENEDEAIFDICFREELEDILSCSITLNDQLVGEEAYLPLDFLPIVADSAEDSTEMSNKIIDKTEKDVEASHDERFERELLGLLESLKDVQEPEETVEAEIKLDFLPIVVSDEAEVKETNPSDEVSVEDILSLEVLTEEVIVITTEETKEVKSVEVDEQTEVSKNEDFEPHKHDEIAIAFDIENEKDDLEEDESKLEKSTDMEQETFRGFSIFEELFRTCDAESKLLLMDEMLAIGDEKEIQFLKTLLDDPDKSVRTKAVSTRKKMEEKLVKSLEDPDHKKMTIDSFLEASKNNQPPEETIDAAKTRNTKRLDELSVSKERKPLEYCFLEEDLQSKKHFNVFEVEFELEHTQHQAEDEAAIAQPEKEAQQQGQPHSLLENLFSFPIKIIDKFNG